MKKKTLLEIVFTATGLLLMTGCVSTIESKADGGDATSMKKMASLYNGERVFVYDPANELPILGLFTEAVIGKPAKDTSRSFAWMKKAAETGDLAAMVSVGQYYGEGFGTETSYSDSAAWFSKALKAASEKKEAEQQISYNELCKKMVSWFNEHLSSKNVIAYYDVLLQISNYLDPTAICRLIAWSDLNFAEKVTRMDAFSEDFKRSAEFASVVNEEIKQFMVALYDKSRYQKLFDYHSGLPVNVNFCCDYDIAEQIIKEKKLPDRFAMASLLKKESVPLQVTDRGTFFGARTGDLYFMADFPDEVLIDLYEYTRPPDADDVFNSMFGGLLGGGKVITPIVVYSNNYKPEEFLYPELYLFGVRKRVVGIKVEDIIEKLKSDYENLTVKNLSEEKVTKVIIGTAYRVTYKPVGFRLENDGIFMTVKSEKETGLQEPKLEKIQPGDPDYLFALVNAKVHAGFSYSPLEGYPQKEKDKIHQEEDEAFEEFFNRDLKVADMEKQLAQYGIVASLDYTSSDTKAQLWHKVMQNKKNYRLESSTGEGADNLIDMAVTSVLSNFLQMQAQLNGQRADENVVIIECFDKALYARAMEQYPKIQAALAKKAERKKQEDYEQKKREQLNF